MSSSLTRGTIFLLLRQWAKGIEQKKLSLEPDSNQRPKDLCTTYYSPPLYQLSYQGNMVVRERMCARILEQKREEKKSVAADGFDPSTSGLWAQHASTAPRCCHGIQRKVADADAQKEKKFTKPRCVPCLWRRRKKRKRPIRDLNP